MTQEELRKWLQMGADYAPIAVAVGSAAASGADRAQDKANAERDKAQQAFNNLLNLFDRESEARGGHINYLNNRQQNNLQRALSLGSLDPLGAEQEFAGKMGMKYSSTRGMKNRPTVSGVFNPFNDVDENVYGKDATANSIANRRKVLSAILPELDRGSISALGLGDTSSLDSGVRDFAASQQDKRESDDAAILSLLNQQSDAASNARKQFEANQSQQSAQPEKKKSSFWGKLGKGLLKVAPFAAMAIPGVGPVLSAVLGAGAGAASGAMNGGGLKGALLGGALGAIPGGGGGASAGTKFLSNLQKALINPQAMTRLASPFLGKYEGVADLASSFLGGPNFAKPMEASQSPMAQAQFNLPIPGNTATPYIPNEYDGNAHLFHVNPPSNISPNMPKAAPRQMAKPTGPAGLPPVMQRIAPAFNMNLTRNPNFINTRPRQASPLTTEQLLRIIASMK